MINGEGSAYQNWTRRRRTELRLKITTKNQARPSYRGVLLNPAGQEQSHHRLCQAEMLRGTRERRTVLREQRDHRIRPAP